MVLSENEVINLVAAPVSDVIATNRQLQDDHKVHIQGVGFEEVLKRIIGYESVEQFKSKKLITKAFTRPIFKTIINAQSRWKTAQGTSRYHKFRKNSEKLSKEFTDNVLSQVWKLGSMERMVKDFLSKAIYEEFNSFFLVEKGKIVTEGGKKFEIREGIKRLMPDDAKAKPYVVFISVDDVHSFKNIGHSTEYIVLKFGKMQKQNGQKVELFRVIDDVNDYIVEKPDNGDPKISEEFPIIEHGAGRCPAVSVSMINKRLTGDQTKTSPVDDVIQLLDYHLHQFAEHLVSEILHAHPIYYQLGEQCTHEHEGQLCEKGTISFLDKDGNPKTITCPKCKGKGSNIHKDASTVLVLPELDGEGKTFNPSNVAGYVTPDVKILEYQQKSIESMRDFIFSSALGINNVSTSDKLEKTATEAVINLKPLEDIIGDIIDVIETIETSLTEIIGKMFYGDKYEGSEIIYGRKLNLRDENVLLNEIDKAKKSGASYQYIKTLVEELVYTRFVRSESDLQRNILLLELEPMVGYSYKEVEEGKNITQIQKIIKQNFTDYIQRFELENDLIQNYKPESEQSGKIQQIRAIIEGYANADLEKINTVAA